MKTILLKIDEDNDIFEMRIGNEVYTLDNVYQSKYGNLFDELNMGNITTMELSMNNPEHWKLIKEIEESLQYTETNKNE